MWGREEPREGPCSATGFLRGSCPASLILEPISPEKEYNGCPWYLPAFGFQSRPAPSIDEPSVHELALLLPSASYHLSCALRQWAVKSRDLGKEERGVSQKTSQEDSA